MTEIRLFIDTRRQSGDPTPPYAVLTDDHIRAIVERAEEMGLLNQPREKVTVSVDGAIMKAAQIMEKERDVAIATGKDVRSLCECLRVEVEALKASRLHFKDAHAEAMECIKLFYGVAVSMSPRKYEEAKAIRLAEALLKHQNKDASK